jgi:predicted transposase/invertase (TIGR01784 family)
VKRYLDPKNDLVFKRVFGEHPKILRAFLNEVLPLQEDEKIESLEYLSPEQVPEIPVFKHSVVDVRCIDLKKRQFIVEMQMDWTTYFTQRVFFNASKAYVRQLLRTEDYKLLQPVYGLSLIADIFDRNTEKFYHHFRFLNVENTQQEIKGLQLVFIELPKFRKSNPDGVETGLEAWLRYLSETGDDEKAPKETEKWSPELQEALQLAELAAYTRDQLEAYDRYWDGIRFHRDYVETKARLKAEAEAQGRAEGEAKGRAEGRAEGEAKGRAEGEAKGRAEGEALGEAKGRAQAMNEAVQKLVNRGMSMEEAKSLLGVD